MDMSSSRKRWTASEIDRLSTHRARNEVIGGERLVTTTPSYTHQRAALRLAMLLTPCCDAAGIEAFIAPAEVRFSDDDRVALCSKSTCWRTFGVCPLIGFAAPDEAHDPVHWNILLPLMPFAKQQRWEVEVRPALEESSQPDRIGPLFRQPATGSARLRTTRECEPLASRRRCDGTRACGARSRSSRRAERTR